MVFRSVRGFMNVLMVAIYRIHQCSRIARGQVVFIGSIYDFMWEARFLLCEFLV